MQKSSLLFSFFLFYSCLFLFFLIREHCHSEQLLWHSLSAVVLAGGYLQVGSCLGSADRNLTQIISPAFLSPSEPACQLRRQGTRLKLDCKPPAPCWGAERTGIKSWS